MLMMSLNVLLEREIGDFCCYMANLSSWHAFSLDACLLDTLFGASSDHVSHDVIDCRKHVQITCLCLKLSLPDK